MKEEKNINMKCLSLLMILLPAMAVSQYSLKSGSQIMINTQNGDLSLTTENELLQCGNPVASDVITYIECGNNSVMNDQGQCEVNSGESFDIDYGLNDADSCVGELGTPEWRGSHSIGTGTGNYSYTITNGINDQVTFRLTCDRQQNFNKTYKKVLHRGVVDLRNVLESGIGLAIVTDKMFQFDLLTSQLELMSVSHELDKSGKTPLDFMIRQLNDQLHVIPTTSRNPINLPVSKTTIDKKLSTYMKVTHIQPTADTKTITDGIKPGKCDSMSDQNNASINVSFVATEDACHIDLEKPAFLVWYLLEK